MKASILYSFKYINISLPTLSLSDIPLANITSNIPFSSIIHSIIIIMIIFVFVFISILSFVVFAERPAETFTKIPVHSLLDPDEDFEKRNRRPLNLVYSLRSGISSTNKKFIKPVPFLRDINDPTGLNMLALLPEKQISNAQGYNGIFLSHLSGVQLELLKIRVNSALLLAERTAGRPVQSNSRPVQTTGPITLNTTILIHGEP